MPIMDAWVKILFGKNPQNTEFIRRKATEVILHILSRPSSWVPVCMFVHTNEGTFQSIYTQGD